MNNKYHTFELTIDYFTPKETPITNSSLIFYFFQLYCSSAVKKYKIYEQLMTFSTHSVNNSRKPYMKYLFIISKQICKTSIKSTNQMTRLTCWPSENIQILGTGCEGYCGVAGVASSFNKSHMRGWKVLEFRVILE